MKVFLGRSSEEWFRVLRRLPMAARWRWIRRKRYGVSMMLPARDIAISRLESSGNPVIEKKGDLPVWLLLPCPCRCGTTLRLNLMRSHFPVWCVSVDAGRRVSISPSVDVTTCGSHFWVREGRVDWVD